MITTDILIIGAGPAGLTAGLYAARSGHKTTIIENFAPGGQINLTPDIANFPGYMEISGAELAEKMLIQSENAGCDVIYDEIKDIDFDKKTITTEESAITYRALIIAGGCRPRGLGVKREDDFVGLGIHYCGLCDGNFYRGKDVLVIGGGNHAIEEAIYLTPIAKSITIISNSDKLKAQQVLVKQLDPQIKIYYKSGIAELHGEQKITGVTLKSGEVLSTDGIFVAIGRTPNTELYRGKLELAKDGYIVTDEMMQTSIGGVFAAGDIIKKQVRQVVTACADGAIAATNAAAYVK